MLGTEREWYKRVPRGIRENLLFRRFLRKKASNSLAVRRALVEACRRDVCFFISAFVFQYNGTDSTRGPFIAWECQEKAVLELVRCVEEGEDAIIEKSRDMGASWLCLIIVVWYWLFHPWTTILVMSKSEDAVDDGTSESLFWKIDFILDMLPIWLLQGFVAKKNRKGMQFKHPNGSIIYGATSTGRAGVGAKVRFMFIDEFGLIEEGREVLHRTTDTTRCRIFNGTHRGMGTAFYELTDPKSVAGQYINKIVLHWTQHPEKNQGIYQYNEAINKIEVLDKSYHYADDFKFVYSQEPLGGPFPGIRSPWYDVQCPRKGNARAIAMDLDIDPSGSVKQFFNAIMIRHLIVSFCVEPYWRAEFHFDYELGRPVAMERHGSGRVKLWCHFHNGLPPLGVYGVAADVSQGTGATPSTCCVVNIETGQKVLQYADPNIDPKQFGSFLVALCWLFKDRAGHGARLCWEIPGPGVTLGAHVVKELQYRNVWWRAKKTTFRNSPEIAGWSCTVETKKRLLNEYAEALKTGKYLNPDKEALEECLKFAYTPSGGVEHAGEPGKGDPSGARMNHGDLTIADGIACMLMREGTRFTTPEMIEQVLDHNSILGRRQMRARAEKESEAWT